MKRILLPACMTLLITSCGDLVSPSSRDVVAEISGPTTLVGRRDSTGRVTCDFTLQVRVSGGNNQAAYARWGTASLNWAKLAVAETTSSKWGTDDVVAFWQRPVTFVGESHPSRPSSVSWNGPFMITYDFAYFSALDGELSPSDIRRVQHTIRCE
jgi:hypothetical protein